MTSIIKVQNIQYTDGDAALTIADGGIVTGHNTLNVSHGTSGTNVATFINTSDNSNINGVVHVKQTGATNQPTMVLEQTGDGGNPADTQGLHIRMAGQNQGSGHAIRVTTTNSNLNSGNAFDAFSVTNGGNLDVKNTSNASTLSLNQAGQLSLPKQPAFQAYYNTESYCWSDTTDGGFHLQTLSSTRFNRGNHYNTTNHRFIAPVAGVYHFYGQFFTNYTSNYARGGVQIRVNGVAKTETWIGNYDTPTSTTSTLTIELAANDYVQLYTALHDGNATSNNYSVYCGATVTYLTGHLIG